VALRCARAVIRASNGTAPTFESEPFGFLPSLPLSLRRLFLGTGAMSTGMPVTGGAATAMGRIPRVIAC